MMAGGDKRARRYGSERWWRAQFQRIFDRINKINRIKSLGAQGYVSSELWRERLWRTSVTPREIRAQESAVTVAIIRVLAFGEEIDLSGSMLRRKKIGKQITRIKLSKNGFG